MKSGIHTIHWNLYRNKVAAEKAQKAAAAKKSAEPAPVRKDSASKARQDSTSGNRGNNRDNKGGQRNREGKIPEGFNFGSPASLSCYHLSVLSPASARFLNLVFCQTSVLNQDVVKLFSWTLVSRGELFYSL